MDIFVVKFLLHLRPLTTHEVLDTRKRAFLIEIYRNKTHTRECYTVYNLDCTINDESTLSDDDDNDDQDEDTIEEDDFTETKPNKNEKD